MENKDKKQNFNDGENVIQEDEKMTEDNIVQQKIKNDEKINVINVTSNPLVYDIVKKVNVLKLTHQEESFEVDLNNQIQQEKIQKSKNIINDVEIDVAEGLVKTNPTHIEILSNDDTTEIFKHENDETKKDVKLCTVPSFMRMNVKFNPNISCSQSAVKFVDQIPGHYEPCASVVADDSVHMIIDESKQEQASQTVIIDETMMEMPALKTQSDVTSGSCANWPQITLPAINPKYESSRASFLE